MIDIYILHLTFDIFLLSFTFNKFSKEKPYDTYMKFYQNYFSSFLKLQPNIKYYSENKTNI